MVGLELTPVPALSVATVAGAKILVSGGVFRHGALLLTPANVKVLGALTCQLIPVIQV